jgi:hypothetical protein
MIRFALALLIAPLLVPLVTAVDGLRLTLQHAGHPDIHYLTVGVVLWWAMISYGSTLLLGVPMLVFVRWLGLSGWWVAGMIGFFIGAALWLVAAVWYLVAHGGVDIQHLAIQHLARQIVILGPSNFFSWPFSASGAAVAVIFWLIARPDRSSKRGA